MGWSDCGVDSTGRPIGYAYDAVCDHPECSKEIDRGLSYACGGMHGEDSPNGSCELYFCWNHLIPCEDEDGKLVFVCKRCEKNFPEDDDETDQRTA